MTLVKITESDHLIIDLIYGTERNFTGKPIYQNPVCYLRQEAADCLYNALSLAKGMGMGLRIYDAFRPMEAQNILWQLIQNPLYVANPHIGSNHSRGVAVDINLIDENGEELNMGTPVDEFSAASHHGHPQVSVEAQKNRYLLLGLMTAAGWEKYDSEWWHYQLPDVKSYELLNDSALEYGMMESPPYLT